MNGVVFDLDGTLIDSLADIATAMNRSLASLGMPGHALDAYRGFVGDGARRLAERALPPGRADLVDPVLDAYREVYREHALDQTRPYPGIPELLAKVRVPMAVVSNKPDAPTRQVVAALFPDVPFRWVAGHRSGLPLKPDPFPAREACEHMGVDPESCGFVGDTRIDVDTARAAGMTPIGVAWGFRPDELRAAGVDILLDAPADLLRWL